MTIPKERLEQLPAFQFAKEKHGDQLYGDRPYTYHLAKVYEIVSEHLGAFIWKASALSAALLHDVLEDTEATLTDVLVQFGPETAILVFALTNEPGSNRARRHKRTYEKILASGPDAVNIKVADRIANTVDSIVNNLKLLKMYQKEWPHFKETFEPYAHREIWALLEDVMEMGFRYCPPKGEKSGS